LRIYNKDDWAKIKYQGKSVYILTHWILSAAFPLAIVLPLVKGIIREKNLYFVFPLDFLTSIFLYTFLCTIISVVLGLIRWNQNEKIFNQNSKL